jgi:predicted nucleic acid-binding protein
MLIVDTNVISEVVKDAPHYAVAVWLRACPAGSLWTTSISRAEIVFGILRLPDGIRKSRLMGAAKSMFATAFEGRILSFDVRAADQYAELRVIRARLGRPITTEDGMIAAIARVHDAALATRDLGGFDRCGVTLINPWETPA